MSYKKESTPPLPQQLKVEVLFNRHIKADCYRIALKTPSSFFNAVPGQFIHIRVVNDLLPLLRRPFSISSVTARGVEIVYKVVGKGTKALSGVKRGEYLDILGPLGKGFFICDDVKRHLLIGGGIGVAPLVFLARRIIEKKDVSILVFLGFKTAGEIICQEQFSGENFTLNVATEDGSCGYKGMVSCLIDDYLKKTPFSSKTCIYACGPRDMLKAVANLASRYGILCQVLMEEIIGCGVGACRGCVIKGKTGYLRVCKEGPVFDAKDIMWD